MSNKPFKTIVYIDGFNFYHSLKDTPYKWLDIEKLIKITLNLKWHNIVKIKYFTAKTPFPDSALRQEIYLKAIKTSPLIEIICGKFKKRNITIKNKYINKLSILKGDQNKIESIRKLLRDNIICFPKYVEKETDVNIATHIVYDCCKEDIEAIAILSNDTDLKKPLKFAKKKLQKKVIVIVPLQTLRFALKDFSHKTIELTKEHLQKSRLPDVVNGIHKPKEWD